MTSQRFSDHRSTATILSEARKRNAGSIPAVITRLEELDAHHQDLLERMTGLNPINPPRLVPGGVITSPSEVLVGGPEGAEALYEHAEPIGTVNLEDFVEIRPASDEDGAESTVSVLLRDLAELSARLADAIESEFD